MTLPIGTKVHYVTQFHGACFYNGRIVGPPHMVRDEPEDEPYEVYPVQPVDWNAYTSWPTDNIREGHDLLDPSAPTQLAFGPRRTG